MWEQQHVVVNSGRVTATHHGYAHNHNGNDHEHGQRPHKFRRESRLCGSWVATVGVRGR
jgi:hypothetical protein